MSAVLRAGGRDFDVDAFLAGCTLPVCAVFRRGEPVFPRTQPGGKRHEESGVNITASEAAFSEFDRQIEEAMEFLRSEDEQLRRLCGFPGVEDVTLDFGVEWRDVAVHCDHLPRELVRLAGALDLGIEVSHYPVAEEEPND